MLEYSFVRLYVLLRLEKFYKKCSVRFIIIVDSFSEVDEFENEFIMREVSFCSEAVCLKILKSSLLTKFKKNKSKK